RIGPHFEFRFLAALHDDRRDAGHAIQSRFEVVGRQFPQSRLRHRFRREGVPHHRKSGEGEPVGGDFRRGRQQRLHARERRVHALERLKHVDAPREEEIDLGGAAARDRLDAFEALHAVERLLDRPRDGDLHLIDRRDPVVDADEDARKIDFGKNRDRNRRREVHAGSDERQDDEDDRLAVTSGPVLVAVDGARRLGRRHLPSSFSSLSSLSSSADFSPGFITRTLAWSSRPRPPTVTTRSPGDTPSTTFTTVPPSSLGSSAAAGMSVTPSSVAATIATWTDVPARSRSPGLSAWTQTCTVVVFTSTAGLTMVTLPLTGSLPS